VSTILVAKVFRCDLCNAQAAVDAPAEGKVPDGWGSLHIEVLAHGLRLRDFCGTCVRKPLAQVISEILGMLAGKVEDDD
jgi:hypothetical protein